MEYTNSMKVMNNLLKLLHPNINCSTKGLYLLTDCTILSDREALNYINLVEFSIHIIPLFTRLNYSLFRALHMICYNQAEGQKVMSLTEQNGEKFHEIVITLEYNKSYYRLILISNFMGSHQSEVNTNVFIR